ncbi:MAG TPA: phage portal protein, partial [Limnochordales bacterium]
MRLRDRVRVLLTGRLPEEVKQEVIAGAAVARPGVARWPEPGFVSWAKEAYGKNELVYACITEIATSVPEAPLRVYRETPAGWEEVPDHPLRQLIRRPNPILSEYELWELTIVHLLLAGNAFWEVVRSRAGRPVELWPLRPDRVRIIPSEDPRIHHTYAYALEGKLYDLGTDVVHFKLANPLDPYFGQPPLRAAVRAVAVDNEATEYVQALLQNDAMPLAVIKPQQRVDDATYERLQARWRQRHGGDKRGGVGVLQPGMEIEVLGLNLRDLEFPDLRAISETRICMAFGVPPILVGAKTGVDRSTYANYAEARRSFWEETVSPLLRRLADRINHKLLPMFGDTQGLEARFDTSEVSALQESVNELWERVTRAVEAGWLLLDEGRAEAGYEALPGGQGRVRLVRSNVMEVPVGPPEAEPEAEGGTGTPARPAVAPRAGPAGGGAGEAPEEPAASPSESAGGGDAEPEARQRGPTLRKAREDIMRDRHRLADRWERRWAEWAAEEFRQEARDTLRAF